MSKPIVQRPAADKDIDSIFEYLKRESPRAAVKFIDDLERTYELIADHPRSGSTRHAEHLRELPYPLRFHVMKTFSRILIYYIDRPDAVEVIRLWDASQGLDGLVTTTKP